MYTYIPYTNTHIIYRDLYIYIYIVEKTLPKLNYIYSNDWKQNQLYHMLSTNGTKKNV